MLTVYFGDKSITFANNGHDGCGNGTACVKSEGFGIAKMLENLENNKNLFVISEHPEETFEKFKKEFKLVGAAGGLVENPDGDVLMIYRNGRWDLPKGHIENGEGEKACSVREVGEETGIENIKCGTLITITYHFYRLNGQWEMKKTYWYAMKSNGGKGCPQTEEGITKVEWVDKTKLKSYLEGSFPSIRKVFYDAELL